jgi:hypothetical protein
MIIYEHALRSGQLQDVERALVDQEEGFRTPSSSNRITASKKVAPHSLVLIGVVGLDAERVTEHGHLDAGRSGALRCGDALRLWARLASGFHGADCTRRDADHQ